MALFDSPDSFRKLGLIGGGLMLAATGNPLGMILPNLYAAQMESGQRRRSAGKANDYLTSPEYVYEDPATGNGQGGLVTKKQALSSEVFNGWGGQSYSAPTQEQRMDAARPMLAQANPEAFQAAATESAARQMFAPPADPGELVTLYSTKDGKGRQFTRRGALEAQNTGLYSPDKPGANDPYKVGELKEFTEGDKTVTRSYLGAGKWGEPTASAPRWQPEKSAPPSAPRVETFYTKDGREYKAEWDGASWVPVGGAKAPTSSRFNNDQNKAAGYANTMTEAEKRISGISGFDPTGAWEAAKGITNVTASPKYQQYKQAAMDWTLAVLRHESGANVPESEAEKYWKNYFPQYGDSAEVIKQKEASRATKVQGVTQASGGAFDRPASSNPSGGGPAVGSVEDGYRFKGGDPADPNSWEPL